MRLRFQRDRFRSFTLSCVSRFLAVFILSSFIVTLVPLGSTAAEEMPCCAGKAEGHCDSGLIKPKPRPVITEPMCGLTSVESHSSRIAEPTSPRAHADANAESHSLQISAETISKDCQMDCGACATVTSRQKRQKDLIHVRITHLKPSTTIAQLENFTSLYSSNENWTRINPRGPPSVL